MIKNQKQAFTLIEITISLAVIAILVTISVAAFQPFKKQKLVDKTASQISNLLYKARSQTLSSKGGAVYGVHFQTDQAVLFATTYVAGNGSNEIYYVDPGASITNITLSGGGNDVIFKRLTGETVQNGTVTVSSTDNSSQKIITIYQSGLSESN